MSRRGEQTEGTRAALLAAGRELFSERGYARVGTEEIVRRARVTQGALCHYFADKKDLFRGVHHQMESELTEAIAAELAAASAGDPFEALAPASAASSTPAPTLAWPGSCWWRRLRCSVGRSGGRSTSATASGW